MTKEFQLDPNSIFFFSYLDAKILYLPKLILNMPSAVEIINFGNHN